MAPMKISQVHTGGSPQAPGAAAEEGHTLGSHRRTTATAFTSRPPRWEKTLRPPKEGRKEEEGGKGREGKRRRKEKEGGGWRGGGGLALGHFHPCLEQTGQGRF